MFFLTGGQDNNSVSVNCHFLIFYLLCRWWSNSLAVNIIRYLLKNPEILRKRRALFYFLWYFELANKIASTMTVTRVAESRTEFKLKSLPDDAISSVKFAPKSNQFLLVSSWDCSVRLYDVTSNTERHKYNHELPVLDVCFRVRIQLFLHACSLVYRLWTARGYFSLSYLKIQFYHVDNVWKKGKIVSSVWERQEKHIFQNLRYLWNRHQ